MKLQKVYFETDDGLELCGLLHEPENNTSEIVIAVHGMQSNCLKRRDDIIASSLTSEGISYLCFNNRGHDLVNSLNRTSDTKKSKIICGTSIENIEDSYYDIKAAIQTMIEKGYTKINLQGHSLGCTKIVYTYNKMLKEDNLEFVKKIKSIILLSMVDIPKALGFFFNDKKEELIEVMEKEEQKGRGNVLVSVPGAILPMSPNTFLKYMKNNESINFARYGEETYDFKELNEIKVPLFMRWGNNNELILQNASELVENLKVKIKNDKLDIDYIDGATHNYKGKEDILASEILNFIKNK